MIKKTIVQIRKQLWREIESLRDKKGFIKAGFPRYSRFFGRDSLIVSWQLLDIEPKICQSTLEILAKFQGKRINKKREEEPGKILHETQLGLKRHPESYFPFPYYGSVDATLLFLILFSFYFKKTGDKKFLKKYWKNILAAINWQIHYGDIDGEGFLEYQRKNPKGLFHQGWKDSFKNHLKIEPPVAIVEAQGYAFLSLKETAKLAKILGKEKITERLWKETKILKKKFNKAFWMKDKRYFALALDRDKNQKKTITSNPGHLLFCKILEKNKEKLVVKRLFQSDLWTPFGIRTHSTKEPDFDPFSYHRGSVWPHDNWIIGQGLKKLGYKKEYLKIKKALLRAYQELRFLPELYGVIDKKITLKMKKPVCYPQAWASGALLNFLED